MIINDYIKDFIILKFNFFIKFFDLYILKKEIIYGIKSSISHSSFSLRSIHHSLFSVGNSLLPSIGETGRPFLNLSCKWRCLSHSLILLHQGIDRTDASIVGRSNKFGCLRKDEVGLGLSLIEDCNNRLLKYNQLLHESHAANICSLMSDDYLCLKVLQ